MSSLARTIRRQRQHKHVKQVLRQMRDEGYDPTQLGDTPQKIAKAILKKWPMNKQGSET